MKSRQLWASRGLDGGVVRRRGEEEERMVGARAVLALGLLFSGNSILQQSQLAKLFDQAGSVFLQTSWSFLLYPNTGQRL